MPTVYDYVDTKEVDQQGRIYIGRKHAGKIAKIQVVFEDE